MREPVKTGTCLGCRAKSFLACFNCSYMKEGLAAQENVDMLTGPINLGEEVPNEVGASESEPGCIAGDPEVVNA